MPLVQTCAQCKVTILHYSEDTDSYMYTAQLNFTSLCTLAPNL